MSLMIEQINEAVAFIQSKFAGNPEVGIILGSGLGNFTTEIRSTVEIPYSDIPHFPVSTVEGHSGKLLIGEMEGKLIVAMAGRFHYYEGYSSEQVVFPIRVMKFLGIRALLISNAAGGVNPAFTVGDLMIIRDHISFSVVNPLIILRSLKPRFMPAAGEKARSVELNSAALRWENLLKILSRSLPIS